ncbi:MAG: polysaccharide deacetylase family protein [Candidatus Methylumidiphilus sp.]
MKPLLSLLLLASAFAAQAAGPSAVALADRALWPEPIASPASFDRASRAEILLFAAAWDAPSSQPPAKPASREALNRIRAKFSGHLLASWRAASAACTPQERFCGPYNTLPELAAAGRALGQSLPANYRPWHANATLFHQRYAAELNRLAALFPKISSEIDTYSPAERSGFELPDRHFLWSFDDGPTAPKGDTDALLRTLAQTDIHALFFVLGEPLDTRARRAEATPIAQTYQGQCVALHGWQHRPHTQWPGWQASVIDTQNLVKRLLPQQYRPWFRPPYGQRLPDSGAFFSQHGLQVALWNIDSQDWNGKVSADAAAQRVMALMLLWRHGVMLFHDIHPKAQTALPWLLAQTQKAGVVWEDCRQY